MTHTLDIALDIAVNKGPHATAQLIAAALRQDARRFGYPIGDLVERVAHGIVENCGCGQRKALRLAREVA